MASVTRSTRRTDGLHHPHQPQSLHHHQLGGATSTRSHHPQINHHASIITRTKRSLSLAEPDRASDAFNPKKQKITVEIPSRLADHQAPQAPRVATLPPPAAPLATVANPPNSAPAPPAAPARPSRHPPTALPASSTTPTADATKQQPQTKHKEKVVNGLKHELNRLKPNKEDTNTREPGRKLRSQEATRFKSELSAYFPDYDEVIGNDPKEHHLLNLDTPIIISDPNPISTRTTSTNKPSNNAVPLQPPLDSYPTRGYGDALFTDLVDSQEIDFGFLEARYKGKSLQDPLPDAYFEPIHKKAERLERSIRNSEKGRAQHERDQVVRLLDGLQGHDWLRVMGVSGITETRKKVFEPARAHFIRGCQAILDKFRAWTAEEKRRKLVKEQALAAAEAEAVANGEEPAEDDAQDTGHSVPDSSVRGRSRRGSSGDPPDYSDVDVSAAKQLREEALAAAKSRAKRAGSRPLATAPPAAAPPEPLREFTSFFAKKYQRDAALSKSRRRGRKAMAWGQPVPEMAEAEFDLPADLRDEETLRAQARRKRRDKRGKVAKKA